MKSYALLIDAENISCTNEMIFECLNKYEKVYIIFAQLMKKISFNELADLCHFIKNGRLNIVKMDSRGKNAADIGLSFIAGKLSSVLDVGSHIEILSNDRIFSNIVNLLINMGFNARQVGLSTNGLTNYDQLVDKRYDYQGLYTSCGGDLKAIIEQEIYLNDMDSTQLVIESEQQEISTPPREENFINGQVEFSSLTDLEINTSSQMKDLTLDTETGIPIAFERFHLKFATKRRTNRNEFLFRLLKLIREGDLLTKNNKLSIANDKGNEKSPSTIIFNCMYLYYARATKSRFKGLKSMVSYFTSTHNINQEFTRELAFYMSKCGLINLNGREIKTVNGGVVIIPILKEKVSPKVLSYK